MKEGALFNPGVEASGPGPGSYDSDKAYGLGTCKLSTLGQLRVRWETGRKTSARCTVCCRVR